MQRKNNYFIQRLEAEQMMKSNILYYWCGICGILWAEKQLTISTAQEFASCPECGNDDLNEVYECLD